MANKTGRRKYTIVVIALIAVLGLAIFLSSLSLQEEERKLPADPDSAGDFNFAAVGDFGCTMNAEQTVNNVKEKDPELFLALGDFSYLDTSDCWLELIKPVEQITRIVMGNHEDPSSPVFDDYMSHFGLTNAFYSFDYQNIHFLLMNTEEEYSEGSPQYDFVKADLANATLSPDIASIVVAYHRYAYSSPGVTQMEEDLREIYHPMFQQYEVDLVLSGHEHNYQRSYPLRFNIADSDHPIITDSSATGYKNPQAPIFVIVGTGGVNLFSPVGKESYIAKQHVGYGFLNIDVTDNGSTLIGTFYGNDGSIIDRFTITKSPLPNNVPIAHAGIDIRVLEDARVVLDGSTSVDLDGDVPLSYSWKQTRGNSKVTLSNSDKPVAEFIAPSVGRGGDTLVFELTVIDSKGLVDPTPDSVVVIVKDNPYAFDPYLTLTGSSYEQIPSTESLQLEEFSVAAWFRTTMSASNGTETVIANKGGFGLESAGSNMNYGIWLLSGGRIQGGFETANGSDRFVTSTKSYADGLWHLATVTSDGIAVRLYVDRELVAASSRNDELPDRSGLQPFRVGANSFLDDRYFIGDVDEVRVWSRAISPVEITDLYLTGTANTRGQVLYLPFESDSTPSVR